MRLIKLITFPCKSSPTLEVNQVFLPFFLSQNKWTGCINWLPAERETSLNHVALPSNGVRSMSFTTINCYFHQPGPSIQMEILLNELCAFSKEIPS